jgi:hypothetical protein
VPKSHDHDMPEDIDPDALAILREGGFIWDTSRLGFRRRDAVIDYKFLHGQKLVEGGGLSARDRIGQLQRLRILIQGID